MRAWVMKLGVLGVVSAGALTAGALMGGVFLGMGPAQAQETSSFSVQRGPVLPRPLEQQKLAGSQVYYLGRHGNMNGWMMVRGGQPEFYYAPEDNSVLVMGFLFDKEGNPVTPMQLTRLQQSQQRDITDMVVPQSHIAPNSPSADETNNNEAKNDTTNDVIAEAANDNVTELKAMSPGEQLYQEVTNGAKLLWGQDNAPAIYAFIDPNCVHCHHFLTDIAPKVESGEVAVNILPVGYNARSVKQAAFILASADGVERMLRYKDGEGGALPEANINTDAVNKNVDIQAKWGLQATPVLVYKSNQGEVRLVRGRPASVTNLINDLTAN